MNPQVTRKKPMWRRFLRGAVVVVAALFLIALAARLIWGYVEARRLNVEITRIQAAGEPLTFKDFEAGQPKINEADDAGPYYEAGLALLRDKDAEPLWDAAHAYADSLQKSPTSRPSRDAAEKVDRLLADNAATVEMIDRGAQRPGCAFDIGVEYGMERCLERIGQMRNAAKLLSFRALVRASQGKGDEAVDSLVCVLRFARAFDRQPVLIALLARTTCVSLACKDVGVVIEIGRPSEVALAHLQEALLATEDPGLRKRMLLAEQVFTLQLTDVLIAGNGPSGLAGDAMSAVLSPWPTGGFWGRPAIQRLAVGSLRLCRAIAEIADKPLPETLEALRKMDPASSGSGAMLQPVMSRAFVLIAQRAAEVRCAAVAVAVERCRRAHGRLPTTLNELTPEYVKSLPSDPFTGKELRYRHDERSYVGYSVGEDGVDDGGEVDRGENKKRPRDNGIRVRIKGRLQNNE